MVTSADKIKIYYRQLEVAVIGGGGGEANGTSPPPLMRFLFFCS